MPDDWDLPEGQTQYSEVDELKARLAEVTAERDQWRRAAELAERNSHMVWDGSYLDQLLDAVEAHLNSPTYSAEARRVALQRLAAKIRKERS